MEQDGGDLPASSQLCQQFCGETVESSVPSLQSVGEGPKCSTAANAHGKGAGTNRRNEKAETGSEGPRAGSLGENGRMSAWHCVTILYLPKFSPYRNRKHSPTSRHRNKNSWCGGGWGRFAAIARQKSEVNSMKYDQAGARTK